MVAFGGGAHMCLGLHFAYMQANASRGISCRISAFRWSRAYTPLWQMWPIPKPRDGLRVTLSPV